MIHWKIDEKEADYVLQCLQQRPFVEVNALVHKLIQQANTPPSQPPPVVNPDVIPALKPVRTDATDGRDD